MHGHVRAVVVAPRIPPLSVPAVSANPGSYAVSANPGSYYAGDVNPRFGDVPELGYSNALFFRVYPRTD